MLLLVKDASGRTKSRKSQLEQKTRKRPLLCSLILSMALTYFLVIFLLFAAALVFSGDIIRALSHYLPPGDFEDRSVVLFTLCGRNSLWRRHGRDHTLPVQPQIRFLFVLSDYIGHFYT